MLKCKVCNKEFKYKGSYEKHIVNCKPKKFICKICNKEFKTGGSLGGHMACAHGKNNIKKEFKCPICNEILYTNKGAFENHIKNHDVKFKKNKSEKIKKSWNNLLNDNKKRQKLSNFRSKHMKENNPMFNKETKEKMKNSLNKRISNLSDEEYSKLITNYINAPKKGNAVNHSGKYTPTKPEQIIIDLNINGLIYNGNKKDSKTIRFKNRTYKRSATPDFYYKFNENKLIEVFGVYWHPKEDEKNYIEMYKKDGYEVLILWETDIYKNIDIVKSKILKFINEK